LGIFYRTGQFWKALLATSPAKDMDLVRSILSPEQVRLFEMMQPGEQIHSIKVARQLIETQHNHPDLLAAALLHDVGKIIHPLQLWERVWLVLGNTFFPRLASQWRREYDKNVLMKHHWQRAFVVHQQHAGWGAELARKAGANPLCISLIKRHQDTFSMDADSKEDQLLYYLQEADNLS
jgi:putative nucleotidyltransferase with HDIG domain